MQYSGGHQQHHNPRHQGPPQASSQEQFNAAASGGQQQQSAQQSQYRTKQPRPSTQGGQQHSGHPRVLFKFIIILGIGKPQLQQRRRLGTSRCRSQTYPTRYGSSTHLQPRALPCSWWRPTTCSTKSAQHLCECASILLKGGASHSRTC
jgi:hypothetical protein